MFNPHVDTSRHHHISVLYGDGRHAFRLARGATLGDLADLIGGLDALHYAGPLSIDVRLELQSRRRGQVKLRKTSKN